MAVFQCCWPGHRLFRPCLRRSSTSSTWALWWRPSPKRPRGSAATGPWRSWSAGAAPAATPNGRGKNYGTKLLKTWRNVAQNLWKHGKQILRCLSCNRGSWSKNHFCICICQQWRSSVTRFWESQTARCHNSPAPEQRLFNCRTLPAGLICQNAALTSLPDAWLNSVYCLWSMIVVVVTDGWWVMF